MHLWTRTAQARAGKEFQAIAWGKKTAEYVNTKFPDLKTRFFVDQFGVVGQMRWMAEVKDLNEFNGKFVQLMQDKEYMAMIAAAEGLFADGTGRDALMMEI